MMYCIYMRCKICGQAEIPKQTIIMDILANIGLCDLQGLIIRLPFPFTQFPDPWMRLSLLRSSTLLQSPCKLFLRLFSPTLFPHPLKIFKKLPYPTLLPRSVVAPEVFFWSSSGTELLSYLLSILPILAYQIFGAGFWVTGTQGIQETVIVPSSVS